VRSSGRIPKEIPILLIGSDLDGRVFSEHTTTVLLSLHGAGVLSSHKLSPEQELVLRWPEKNKEEEVRVVGQIGSQSSRYTYGVAFFDPHLNFWEIDFPPISALEIEQALLSLVCGVCNTLEKIDDTSIEADVCATNDGVIRSCQRCGTSTLWKPASAALNKTSAPTETTQLQLFSPPAASASAPGASPDSNSPPIQPPQPFPAPPPLSPASFYPSVHSYPEAFAPSPAPCTAVLTPSPPEKPVFPRTNRRKHPRVKVKYSACIRHPDRGDDVVVCEDMSKGGLRFKSHKHYFPRSLVEVAVPYADGQPAIFVPAQIVFVEELSDQRLYRYGVQYLKPIRCRDSF
jgi:hypothetical protein